MKNWRCWLGLHRDHVQHRTYMRKCLLCGAVWIDWWKVLGDR